jgi:hydroxycarboxylate dehydrogenase B
LRPTFDRNRVMAFVLIDHQDLRQFAAGVFAAAGSGPNEAGTVADHLVEANLRGHDSHGVGLIPMYVADRLAGHLHPNLHAELVRDDGPFGIFDGGMGYGHVLAREATGWGVARARASGLAVVALRRSYHLARLGTYGELAAAAGLVAILFVNVVAGRQKVAPFGGSDGRMHTNPICIAVPAGDGRPPVILDFATSRVAVGKLRVAYNERRPVRPGILVDAATVPTTDPAVMFKEPLGALLSFGEHKGSGLGLMCELLAGALTGAPANDKHNPPAAGVTNNLFGIIVDPARFGDPAVFRREVDAVVAHLKASPPADPDEPVMVAGEPEARSRAIRLTGGIPIDATSWREIVRAAGKVGAPVGCRVRSAS